MKNKYILMEEEFRKLVNPYRRGGAARRKMLEYIAAHPGTSLYKIAKNVFGDGLTYTAQVQSNVKRLAFVDGVQLLRMERDERGTHHVYLTEEGRRLCLAEGLQLASGKPWLFITELNRQLDGMLTPSEIAKLESLLTEPVVRTLEEIAEKSKFLSVFRPIFPNTPLESLSTPLSALWAYGAEKELAQKMDEGIKEIYSSFSLLCELYPLLKNHREWARKEYKRILKRIDLKNLIQQSMYCIPIARKHGTEKQLDELLEFVTPLLERGKEAKLNRGKVEEIYAHRLGLQLQTEIARRGTT